MDLVIGAFAGLFYGGFFGLLKHVIRNSARLKRRGANKQIYLFMGLSMLINVGSLLLIYFCRNLLPWSFTAMLIGAALSLSLLSQVSAIAGARKDKAKEAEKEQAE